MGNFKAFFKLLRIVACFLFLFGGLNLSAQDIGVTNIEINEGTIDSSAASKTYNLCSTETVTLDIGIKNFGTNPETITASTVLLYITGVNSFTGGTASYAATINPVTTIAPGAIATLTFPTDFTGTPPSLNFSNYGISTIIVSSTSTLSTNNISSNKSFVY